MDYYIDHNTLRQCLNSAHENLLFSISSECLTVHTFTLTHTNKVKVIKSQDEF